MNFESALLIRAVEENNWRDVVAHNFTVQDFTDLDNRTLFQFLQGHYLKHGELPTPAYTRAQYPDYNWQEVADDKITALATQVRHARIYNEVMNSITRVCNPASDVEDSILAQDPPAAVKRLLDNFMELNALMNRAHDQNIVGQYAEILADYEQRASQEGMVGIPWPWETMNAATQGIHPGSFVIIFGRPKSMKTWVLLVCAFVAHQQKKRIVFASQEMDYVEIRDRFICIFCELDYKAFSQGHLTDAQLQEFKDNQEAWDRQPPFYVTRLQQRGALAVMEFRSKLTEHEADIGFFDAIYLAGDDWKDMVTITRHLKALAADLKIPILGTCQENREGHVAYSDSFIQDCDVAIRVKRSAEEKKNKELILELPAMRRAELDAFAIHAYPANNFREKYTVQEDDEANDNFF